MPANTRSARLLERLGFEREGMARAYLKIADKWEDHVLTARINPKG
jgi:[ribosomal protein S5]-alanine N-acetyltransferase